MSIKDSSEKVCGVYLIFDPETDKTYVGSSGNVEKRRSEHLRALECGTHGNKHLQNLFNKRNNLEFLYVDLKDRDLAYDLEQSIIDSFHESKLLLNISTDARRHGGGRIPDEITRAKMSAWQIGKKHTPETIAKLKEKAQGRKPCELATELSHKIHKEKRERGEWYSEEGLKKFKEQKGLKVIVDDVIYDTGHDAAKAHNIHQTTAVNRLASPNFPNWTYLNKEHSSSWKHKK